MQQLIWQLSLCSYSFLEIMSQNSKFLNVDRLQMQQMRNSFIQGNLDTVQFSSVQLLSRVRLFATP